MSLRQVVALVISIGISMVASAQVAAVPEARAVRALLVATLAAEGDDLDSFHAALELARAAVAALPDPTDAGRLGPVLELFADIEQIWRSSADTLETRERRRALLRVASDRLQAIRATPGAAPQPAVIPIEVCPPAVPIEAIEPNPQGLLIRSSSAMTGSLIARPQTSAELPSAVPVLTLDLPNTTLAGVPPRAEWPSGPLESMRATRYRTAEVCGIRLRLQPRQYGVWHLVTRPDGVSLTLQTVAAAEPGGESVDAAPSARPGLANLSTSFTGSQTTRADSRSTSSGFLALALAQALPRGGTLSGFVSEITPGQASGSPFAAIAVSSVPFGDLDLGAVIGDTLVTLGDTGSGDVASVTSLLFRGAGISVQTAGALSVQVFGGRAASASLLRVGGEGTVRPRAHDTILGAQSSWIPEGNYAVAAGVLHTATPARGPTTLNLFEAAEYKRSPVLRIRLLLEQSHALDNGDDGFAYTLQSRVLTRSLTLDGYYRALSSRFRPAGGAGFYASLQRSYGLAAGFRRNRFSTAATFSQAKIFNILDPETVGSFTTSHHVSAAYTLFRRLSLQGSYGQSTIRSDPGATIAADSRSQQAGGGIGFGFGKFDVLLQVANSTTHNEADPALDFSSRRTDLDVRSGYGRDIYGRFSVGNSERRNGAAAGSDYRAAIGGPLVDTPALSLSAEAGIAVIPAGVAQTAFRQTFATLRVTPNRLPWLSGVQLTFERVRTERERFDAFFASVGAQKILRWGEGTPIFPQLETRAMRLGGLRIARPTSGSVHAMIFEDRNQNSKLDPGEAPIAQAILEIAGRRYRSDANGQVTAPTAAGKQSVRLLPRGAAIGFFVPSTLIETEVVAGETAQVTFGLKPAGRLVGKVETEGDIEPLLLANLLVRASGPVDRQAVTDAAGTFEFGLLPEGEYRVVFVPEALRERNLAPGTAGEATARVARGARANVTLHIRKLTARERFGT